MNTFPGRYENGEFISDSGIIRVTPKPEDQAALAPYEGRAVHLGIRSERFIAGIGDDGKLAANIEVVEMLGKEKLLYCELPDGTNCVISQPGYYEYAPDEVHNFHLDKDGLHFFASDTGERIN